MNYKNKVSGVFLIVLCVAIIYLSAQLGDLPVILRRGLEPWAFPMSIAIIIIVLSIILMIIPPDEGDEIIPFNKGTTFSFLALPLFILCLRIDFFIALSLSSLYLHLIWSKSIRIWPMILLAILLPIFIFLLFGKVLSIRFPDGILTQFLYR